MILEPTHPAGQQLQPGFQVSVFQEEMEEANNQNKLWIQHENIRHENMKKHCIIANVYPLALEIVASPLDKYLRNANGSSHFPWICATFRPRLGR